jgi:hypothetical protein
MTVDYPELRICRVVRGLTVDVIRILLGYSPSYCCNIFFALGSRPTFDPERFVATTHKFIVFPCVI